VQYALKLFVFFNGLTAYANAIKLRISESSAHRWIRRYNEEKNLKVHNSTGWPRKTTEEDEIMLVFTGKKMSIDIDWNKVNKDIFYYLKILEFLKLVYCHSPWIGLFNVYLSLLSIHFVQIISIKKNIKKLKNRELELSMSMTTMVINLDFPAECMTTLSIIGSPATLHGSRRFCQLSGVRWWLSSLSFWSN